MQEFINSLKEVQLESASPTDITLTLLRFQTEINALFFHGWKTDNIHEAFQEIWKFFLFAASHSQSGVRLASYRATGAFLLKLSPYYTFVIQNTFSDMSMVATIDVKSSAIIASSFAFISSRISLPYLGKFLDNTPVFHHFTISDPIFSEHLSSIITNLGELGFDWFSTLLHSFLALTETSNDRYLMKSITAVISHDPINLMNDFLQYISDQNLYKKHLPLASYIITTGHIYDDSFDLFNLAKTSISVLNHPEESNPTMIDSALQILSIKSPSFYLQIDPVGNDTVNLTLSKKKPDQSMDLIDFDFTDKSDKNEHISIVIKVSVFKVRPTIYLLELPVMYSEPQPEDGALTLAAKFKSLASRINAYPEKTSEVLSTFIKYYNKKYDSNVSAVIQGISECIITLINNSDLTILTPLIESVIFTPCTNWFHSSDVLSVIDNMNHDSFEKLFGRSGLERIVCLLIELSLSANVQVSIKSTKIIRKLVISHTFQKLTTLVASHIDIFDDNNLSHLLPLLTDILRDHPEENYNHLHYLVFQLIELQDFYRTNLPVLTSLLHFIGNFTINFVRIKKLNPTFLLAVSIIAASIQCVSGFSEWENIFLIESLGNMVEIISNDLRSKNIDVSSENSLNYDEYLAPCVAALKFVYGIPINMIQKDFILILYRKLRNIFPLDSAKFVRKFWPMLNDEEKVQAILKMHKSLRFVQNYQVPSIIAILFIQIYRPEFYERLDRCKSALIHTANYALKNKKCLKEDQETVFKAIYYYTDEKSREAILNSSNFEEDVLKHCPELYTILFKKPNPGNMKKAGSDQFIDMAPVHATKSDPNILANPYKINNVSSSLVFDYTDPSFRINSQSSSQVDIFDSPDSLFGSANQIPSQINPTPTNSQQNNNAQQQQQNNNNNLNVDLLNNFAGDNKSNHDDLFGGGSNAKPQNNFSDDLLFGAAGGNQNNSQKENVNLENDLFAQQINSQPIVQPDLFAPQQLKATSSHEIFDISHNGLFTPPNPSPKSNITDDLFGPQPTGNAQSNITDDLFGPQPTKQQTNITDNFFIDAQPTKSRSSFHDDLFANAQPTKSQGSIHDDLFIDAQPTKSQSSIHDDLINSQNTNSQGSIHDDLFANAQPTKSQGSIHDDLFIDAQPTGSQSSTHDDLISSQNTNSQGSFHDDLFVNAQPTKSQGSIHDDLFNTQQQQQQQVVQNSSQDIIDISQSSSQDVRETVTLTLPERKYVFVKPTTDLSKQLSPTDPLVKIQIKKSMRKFTAEELSQILAHMSKIDDVAGIKLVLQYCITNSIQLSVKGLNFTEKAVPIVIRYLRLSKSNELETFIAPFYNDELLPYSSYLQVVVSNTSRYLNHILEMEKVTKPLMKNFGSMIPVAQFVPSELVKAVTHCFSKAKSQRKLNYSLVLIQNTLATLKEIPADFLKAVFSLIESKMKELSSFTQCSILNILASKLPNDSKVLDCTMQFKSIVSTNSPELYYVYSIIENLSKSVTPAFSKEVPKMCDYLLNSHTPSIFLTGILLFTFAMKKLTGDRLQSLMRHSLNNITRRLTKTFKDYPVPEIAITPLVNILTLPAFKKYQPNVVSSLTGIIPPISSASFQTYFVILPLSISFVDEKQKFADEQSFIENMSNDLISNERVNIPFFANLFLKIVKSRAEKMTPKSKQENFVMGIVNNFIENQQVNCDFYELMVFICELLTTLNMFNGFTQLLPVMSDQIFANSPRFFPTFAGVALFVKKFRIANANNQTVLAKMNASFIGAGKKMMPIHRSRGMAIQMLADPSKIRTALDLASFNDDCKESDLLLQKLNL
ncbi:hypothetical protein M9Y10_025733 [Tritrichomonas musculus]|uniref:Uncharacterized protein n=1 Tax=Tritrichomonas musculus TaxID=1915356 RepID=A0ABR2HBE8_9EUKA